MPTRPLCPVLLLCSLVLQGAGHGLNRDRRQAGGVPCTRNDAVAGACTRLRDCPAMNLLLSQVKSGSAPRSALFTLRSETQKCPFDGPRPRICCARSRSGGGRPSGPVTSRPSRPVTSRPSRPVTNRPRRPSRPVTSRPFVRPPRTFAPTFIFGRPVTSRPVTSRPSRPVTSRPVTRPPRRPVTSRPFVQPLLTSAPAVSRVPVRGSAGQQPSQLVRLLPPEGQCGTRSFDQRVIGGQGSTIGSWPWAASIGYREAGRRRLLWACGGTLITSRHVLTAAHCVTKLPDGQTPAVVRLGELDFSTDPDCLPANPSVCADRHLDVPISILIPHHQYRGRQNNAFADDIGLVVLSRSVASSEFVRPICLPLQLARLAGGSDSIVGRNAYIAGWGRSEARGSTHTQILQEAKIKIVSPGVCEKSYRRDIRSGLGRRLCAGNGNGVDTCRGDSGGPLMVPATSGVHWYLVGITSFGSSTCGNHAAVYTRVHDYVDWIKNNIRT